MQRMHFPATTGHFPICSTGKGSGKKDLRGTRFKQAPLGVLHVNIPDAFDKHSEQTDTQ